MNWHGLANRLNIVAPHIGMSYSDQKKMINIFLCFLNEKPVLDICAFGEWMEAKYPEYKEKSIEQFLIDKDPENINEWKSLFDIAD